MAIDMRAVAKWGVGLLWLAPVFVLAQAPVVVSEAVGADTGRRAVSQQSPQTPQYTDSSAAAAQPAAGATASGTLFNQLQQLQNQVRDMNGRLEEQERMLQQLKQEQQDNYNNLDKRLSGGQAGGSTGVAPEPTSAPTTDAKAPSAASGSTVPASEAEKKSYTDAYALLKQNDLQQALAAFTTHVSKYPEGEYAGNAHYWMGEIHVLQNHPTEASAEFSILIDKFPDNRKTQDATYKLGTLLFQAGDKTKAQSLLQQAAKGTGPTAALAKTFLKENF